jgi:hypothetical protein
MSLIKILIKRMKFRLHKFHKYKLKSKIYQMFSQLNIMKLLRKNSMAVIRKRVKLKQ